MNSDLWCLHVLKATADRCTLRCDCARFEQRLCVACGAAVADSPAAAERRLAFRCARCTASICGRCLFDCSRTADNAAECDACATANGFRFDVKHWCLCLRLFSVDTHGVLHVECHLVHTIFDSLSDALDAIGPFLAAFYPDSELVRQLVPLATSGVERDNMRRRELRFSTANVYCGSEHARLEVHAKMMLAKHSPILPAQLDVRTMPPPPPVPSTDEQ